MALSSDELVKREISDFIGHGDSGLKLRIFPQSSREDQELFSAGGLTFGVNQVSYGSCDAAWYSEEAWIDPFNNSIGKSKPLIAVEATDALNRGSSGNAQYQRFHHALGAVKAGCIGVYYFRPGKDKIQEDLFAMAYRASQLELGTYIVTDSINKLKKLVNLTGNPSALEKELSQLLEDMEDRFQSKFRLKYNSDWHKFASDRSTLLIDGMVIKHAGRMSRNFTDSSQRAGHIAVGEMYLTKYFFPNKPIIYLFAKMLKSERESLDQRKTFDKEWHLLRNEPDVSIATLDDIVGISRNTKKRLIAIKDDPLKGTALQIYKKCMQEIVFGLQSKTMTIALN